MNRHKFVVDRLDDDNIQINLLESNQGSVAFHPSGPTDNSLMVSVTNTSLNTFKNRAQKTDTVYNLDSQADLRFSTDSIKHFNESTNRYDEKNSEINSQYSVCNYYHQSVYENSPNTSALRNQGHLKKSSRFVSPMYNRGQMSGGREGSSNNQENRFHAVENVSKHIKKTLNFYDDNEQNETIKPTLKLDHSVISEKEDYQTPVNGTTVVKELTFGKDSSKGKKNIFNPSTLKIDVSSFEISPNQAKTKALANGSANKDNNLPSAKSNGCSIRYSKIAEKKQKKTKIARKGASKEKKSSSYSRAAEKLKMEIDRELKAMKLKKGNSTKRIKSSSRKSVEISNEKKPLMVVSALHRREQSAKINHAKKDSTFKRPVKDQKMPIPKQKHSYTNNYKREKACSQEKKEKKTKIISLVKKVAKKNFSPPSFSSKTKVLTEKSEKEPEKRQISLKRLLVQNLKNDRKPASLCFNMKLGERKRSPGLSSSRRKAVDFSKYTKKKVL